MIDRVRRFHIFCDVHQLDAAERGRVVELASLFLQHALANLTQLAANGHAGFQALLASGYEHTNRATVQWLADQAPKLRGF